MNWSHFWSDLTVGQVIGFLTPALTTVVLILSGRAVHNARASVRLLRRLIASVGLLPEGQEHRKGLTLTAQFQNLAEQVEQMQAQRTQEKHDQPPVREGRTYPVEAGRH